MIATFEDLNSSPTGSLLKKAKKRRCRRNRRMANSQSSLESHHHEVGVSKCIALFLAFVAFVSNVICVATNYWTRFTANRHPFKPPGHTVTQHINIIGHAGLWQHCSNLSPDGKKYYYTTVVCDDINRLVVNGKAMWFLLPAWFEVARGLMMLSVVSCFFSFFPSCYMIVTRPSPHHLHVTRMAMYMYVMAGLLLTAALPLYVTKMSEMTNKTVHQVQDLRVSASWSIYVGGVAMSALYLGAIAWWYELRRLKEVKERSTMSTPLAESSGANSFV